jgi:hypothetical protein
VSFDTDRVRAAQLLDQAKAEPSDNIRRNFVGLARAYLRLVEQADQNAQVDLTYETPPPHRSSGQERQP